MQTPKGDRIHIAFFGLRNAGKSTLVNSFTGQKLSIVSDVAGTTTDPVSKAMEILPLGPCLITDTAGLDDDGELGRQRVDKTLDVLATTDIAVWVTAAAADRASPAETAAHRMFLDACLKRNTIALEFRRGDSVDDLKKKIAAVRMTDVVPGLLAGLVEKGDSVLCVVPIDESAPKGRLILPQQQVIRSCLDLGAVCTVCQPEELPTILTSGLSFALVVTDSQVFGPVSAAIRASAHRKVRLTSFSILFARQKGDLRVYLRGLEALSGLRDGDTVLIAEGCTHHRQCNDIGSVKIPKALEKLTGKTLKFAFASGGGFLELAADGAVSPDVRPGLIVQCGGCMLTRREVLRRIGVAERNAVPIVNYGMILAVAHGLKIENVLI